MSLRSSTQKTNEFEVIVYGLVCLDILWRVPSLPPLGGAVGIQEERKVIGGEAANTAIALSRWGVRVALVGNALGEDAEGRLLWELFARNAPQVDTRFLTTSPDTFTSVPVLVATPDGQKTVFGRGRAHLRFPPLDPDLARSVRLFTVDGGAGDAGVRACEVAARAGKPIVAVDYTQDPDVSRLASLSIASRDNLDGNTSREGLNALAVSLRDRYGSTIVTCGEQGCLVAPGGASGKAVSLPAYPPPHVVDTTGAGDVFRAGMIYGRLHGWDVIQSARFASAAAALNCGALGGWTGVRPVEEIQAFQRKTGL